MTVRHLIYKNLAWLNDLPAGEAEAVFLDCCGSREWASRMTARRPFQMLDHLFETAEHVWFALSAADHLEAFAAHPKIGARNGAATHRKRSASWLGKEQAGMNGADGKLRDRLTEVNSLYEDKFGFIFIVCATGREAAEMLAVAEARLGNSLQTEMQLAAEEQRKITEIRLTKLLEK